MKVDQTIKICVDSADVDEVIKKSERLNCLMEEANALAKELASHFPEIVIHI